MALSVTFAESKAFATTTTVPLAANGGPNKTAVLFISSRGPDQTASTLGAMTGWTEHIAFEGSGSDPRFWCYSKAIPSGTPDFTVPNSDAGGWTLMVVDGELGTPATARTNGYSTTMTTTLPGTSGEYGISLGACATNIASPEVSVPATAVLCTTDEYSNNDGSYKVETHPGGNAPSFEYGDTNYTLGWVWFPESASSNTVAPATVASGSAVGSPTVANDTTPPVLPGGSVVVPVTLPTTWSVGVPVMSTGDPNILVSVVVSTYSIGSPSVTIPIVAAAAVTSLSSGVRAYDMTLTTVGQAIPTVPSARWLFLKGDGIQIGTSDLGGSTYPLSAADGWVRLPVSLMEALWVKADTGIKTLHVIQTNNFRR